MKYIVLVLLSISTMMAEGLTLKSNDLVDSLAKRKSLTALVVVDRIYHRH